MNTSLCLRGLNARIAILILLMGEGLLSGVYIIMNCPNMGVSENRGA